MATTINSYSVGLTLDASEYIKNSALSATETRKLRRSIEEARDPGDKLTRQVNLISKALRSGAIDVNTYNRMLDATKRKYQEVAAEKHRADTATGSLIRSVRSLAASYLGLQTIVKSVRLAIDFEQAEARFDVLTGSIQNSKALMGDLKALSDATPLTFGGVQNAAQTMLAFNVPLEDVMRNLKMLGDVSGGNEERFKMMTLAFSQMNAAGRLMGQDLLQMINAGFNPLQQIAETTGESMAELKKRMEAGGISASEVTQAFVDATSEGGRFNGMMDRLADTTGGRMAIAMASLEKAGIQLGQALEPLLTQLTDGINEGTGVLSQLIWLVEKLAEGLAFTIAYWRDFAAVVSGDFSMENTMKLLDSLDQKARDAEAAIQNAGKGKIDQAAADAAATANAVGASVDKMAQSGTTEFEKQIEALKLRNIELEHGAQAMQRHELLAKGLNIYQIFEIEALQEKNRLLEEEERKKDEALKNEKKRQESIKKLQEEARRAYEENVSSALDAARKHFEDERRKAEKIRDEIAKGPQTLEVGSSEAVQFMAEMQNRALANQIMPPAPEPTDEQLIQEAQRQFVEMQQQTQTQKRQEALLQRLLEKMEPTQRIR